MRCLLLPVPDARRLAARAAALACALSAAAPAAAQTRVPDWQVSARVETRPLAPGDCAWFIIDVRAVDGKLLKRPDGNYVGPADFEVALSGPGAASFKWERNTPNNYRICSTFAAGPDRAEIVITYPRVPLPDEEVYPGIAFTAALPVFRGSGGGCARRGTTCRAAGSESPADADRHGADAGTRATARGVAGSQSATDTDRHRADTAAVAPARRAAGSEPTTDADRHGANTSTGTTAHRVAGSQPPAHTDRHGADAAAGATTGGAA
jgi:hypothetical protein